MRDRRILQIALTSTLMLALALLTPATAWADDDAPAPKKVRIRVVKPKGPPAKAGKQAPAPDPMDTVMRWAMGEMGAQMGKAGDADAMLRKWFDGGDDVPLAGLRDALKADGWSPDKLKAWGMQKAMQAGPRMMQRFANRGSPMGPGGMSAFGPMGRSFTTMGPQPGHGGGGCPLCGQAGQQRRGWRAGRGGRGGHGMWQGRRGGRGQRGPRAQGRWGGGMGPRGPMHGMTQGPDHCVIFWNDGSGWHRQEIPGGMGHGPMGRGRMGHGPMGHGPMGRGPMGMGPMGHQGMPPFMGHGGGMAGGQMPPWMRQFMGGRHAPRQGPQKPGPQGQGQQPWMKMLQQYMQKAGGQGAGNDVGLRNLLQLLQNSQGEGGPQLQELLKQLQGLGGAAGGQPQVRVHVVEPRVLEEDVVEDGPAK